MESGLPATTTKDDNRQLSDIVLANANNAPKASGAGHSTDVGLHDGNAARERPAKEQVECPARPITASELPCWQKILTTEIPALLDWPITSLCLPGTHDSGTYGPGACPTNVARFNWQCQSLDIYDQARAGVRYFDLRLERENNSVADSMFWPFHGAAKHTGDRFADGVEGVKNTSANGWRQTIAGQLLRFVQENPTELFVIYLTVKDESKFPDTLWETISNTLGARCIPLPDETVQRSEIPTISDVRQRGQNFVIIVGDEDDPPDANATMAPTPRGEPAVKFVQDFVWKVPGKSVLQSPYVSDTWKSNDPLKVREAIESWMTGNEKTVTSFTHFWVAQCQLTPSINNACGLVQSLWNKNMTTTPAKLAKIMNPYVQGVLIQDRKWRQAVSAIQVDFAEPGIVSCIASINFDPVRQF